MPSKPPTLLPNPFRTKVTIQNAFDNEDYIEFQGKNIKLIKTEEIHGNKELPSKVLSVPSKTTETKENVNYLDSQAEKIVSIKHEIKESSVSQNFEDLSGEATDLDTLPKKSLLKDIKGFNLNVLKKVKTIENNEETVKSNDDDGFNAIRKVISEMGCMFRPRITNNEELSSDNESTSSGEFN